ncbi:NAD-dependent protein deacylase [Corynebacterium yudongzhengii]|uniref:NAD-dependent protein deacylase n=1 Tax=Corynebacterium yudongzhengii TaxID=2080740 RepID=A0A2U1T484_9CORY|nr:NAD-dependent deacylase [Corynebacterium yudongzhengii]AWB81003.1 NAD-dependent protein deacylase [Corynebacterium yudongzhengii]PWC00775.1 NAD-dependent deacylase [Corynebacterium yudongzhengii]
MDTARKILDSASHIEVFTGAGMSADSGIATYRDAITGVWENVDPMAMASIDAWAIRPEEMWAWYLWRASLVRRAEPNPGHMAIARLAQREGKRVTVTTQNIDDLHERGGSENVVHLHGSLFDFRCSICSRPWRGEVELPDEPVAALTPPTCPLCENLIRPGVVWFGEPLPQKEWAEAERRMIEADAVIIVGTSGVVQPAASLPLIAAEAGTPIIEVTPQRTDLSHIVDVHLDGTAGHVLPELIDAT